MDVVFLLAIPCYLIYLAVRSVILRLRRRQKRRLTARRAATDLHRRHMAEHTKRKQRDNAIREKARLLQIPLTQLEKALDFRRAAGFARRAQAVPRSFRRRQFGRFRSALIGHLVKQLAKGGNRDMLLRSLVQLARGLGVAGYEAEYMLAEAEARLRRPDLPPPPSLENQLRELHRRHAERVGVIRALAELDDDIREQLLEAEEQRFAEEMLRTAQPDGDQDLTH
jgi:hypothetical protein